MSGFNDRIAILDGAEGAGLASLLTGLGALGIVPIVLRGEPDFDRAYRYDDRRQGLIDRLDMLSMIVGSDGPPAPLSFPIKPRADALSHFTSDRRISKRRARRLRGKARS